MELQQHEASKEHFAEPMLTDASKQPNKKLTSWAAWSAFLATFSGFFQYGYSIGCVNAAAEPILESIQQFQLERYNTTFMPNELNYLWASLVTCFPVGGLLGCVFVNTFVQKLGQLHTMIFMHCLTILMSVLMALSNLLKSYEVLFIGRIFIGISSACAGIGISPVFAVEVLPTEWRGVVGSCVAVSINIGIFSSNLLGLHEILGSVQLWPILLGIIGLPSVLFVSFSPFMPKGPRTLYILERKPLEAEILLKKLRNSDDVSEEIRGMHQELLALQTSSKLSILQLFRSKSFRPQLISTIVLCVAYQTTGLNGIVMYMNKLVVTVGVADNLAHYAASIIAGVMIGLTLIGAVFVKKFGRRTLLIGGYIAEGIFLIAITISIRYHHLAPWLSYAAILSCLGYLVSFLLGPGGITLLFVAEIFTQTARASAVVTAGFVMWAGFTLVVLVFPFVQDSLGPYAYLLFAAIALSTAVFLYFAIPETRGRSFLEIEASFPQNICSFSRCKSARAKDTDEDEDTDEQKCLRMSENVVPVSAGSSLVPNGAAGTSI